MTATRETETATKQQTPEPKKRWTLLDKFYEIGVIVKGIDGAIELVVGLLLLIVPSMPHTALTAAVSELGESSNPVSQFVANYLDNLDDQLVRSGLVVLIVFLILHGVVKLVLVYCLLRKFHRVYPYAIAVLSLFLAYQLSLLVTAPTISLGVFTALDVAIIVLVYKEYRELRAEARDQRRDA